MGGQFDGGDGDGDGELGGELGGGSEGGEGGGGGGLKNDGGGDGYPVRPQACMPDGHDAAFRAPVPALQMLIAISLSTPLYSVFTQK